MFLKCHSKGATYIRGYPMILRPRSTRLKVGMRPIIEVRPVLGNLRYLFRKPGLAFVLKVLVSRRLIFPIQAEHYIKKIQNVLYLILRPIFPWQKVNKQL